MQNFIFKIKMVKNMIIKHTFKTLIFILLFFYLSGCSEAELENPNIIYVLADDLGYADLGIQGSKEIPTPNIDRLAEDGIRFTNGYVSGAVCAPSRAGLITGRNQVRFGFIDNLSASQRGFDPEYLGLPPAKLAS